jgi:hypothetical protein
MQLSDVLSLVAVFVALGTLLWTRYLEREGRRHQAVTESMLRMVSNSKKLVHESRKGLEQWDNSVATDPLRDAEMRMESNLYRHEVGVELVIIEAFGGRQVRDAMQQIYDHHRIVRRAIWNDDPPPPEGGPSKRETAWATMTKWGPGDPSDQIYKKFDSLHRKLVEAVRDDTGTRGPSR